MKLIIAIVNSDDSGMVQTALMEMGFSATKLATTGGFLRSKNTTFLVGVEEDRVDEAIDLIEKYSQKRSQMIPTSGTFNAGLFSSTPATEVVVGGATIFVVDVEKFEKV